MPGMVSQLSLQADKPGDLWGTSAQFSGDGFSDMQFRVKSVPAADFDAWVAGVRGKGPVLDRKTYTALTRQTQRVPSETYRDADPQLFDAVATQKIPPGPGPQPGAPEHAGREVSAGGGR
ncbi:MAG: COX aromatic rich motif-containing protein [Proteobacteria bacterium]|nr:COX aromatic rich motif-containing protein [Pseudomonadota bacterium]